jgi:hypothetical protein
MAVETNAGPVERALDAIAKSIGAPTFDMADQLLAALSCAALWRVVFTGAMREGDSKLASIAVDQIRNAHHAYRALVQISEVDLTELETAVYPPLDPHPARTLPPP